MRLAGRREGEKRRRAASLLVDERVDPAVSQTGVDEASTLANVIGRALRGRKKAVGPLLMKVPGAACGYLSRSAPATRGEKMRRKKKGSTSECRSLARCGALGKIKGPAPRTELLASSAESAARAVGLGRGDAARARARDGG